MHRLRRSVAMRRLRRSCARPAGRSRLIPQPGNPSTDGNGVCSGPVMPPARPAILRARLSNALFIAELAVALLVVRNWAYVTTYRLYLDQRSDSGSQSTAVQAFDVEQAQVVPRILTRG